MVDDLVPFSIVVPTLNQKQYLPRALNSIKEQLVGAEVIIVDGGSTDGALDFLNSHPSLFNRLISEHDTGQSDAINKGFQLATANYVAWLNSDDWYFPEVLDKVWAELETQDFPDVLICGGSKVDEDGRVLKEIIPDSKTLARTRRVMCVIQPSIFFKKSLIASIGNVLENLHYVMDWEYLNRTLAFPGARVRVSSLMVSAIEIRKDTKTATGGWQRAREIAWVGQRYNGNWDINFVIFSLKESLNKIKIVWLKRSAFYFIEWVSRPLFRWRLCMISGRPSRSD